jgi:pyrroloquinoline quinone (PQQ) biosynthesis protein C
MDTGSLPYTRAELRDPAVLLNLHHLALLEEEARRHPVFDHPFLIRLSKGVYGESGIRHAFIQFSKHVRIFTSCLGHLIGTAPDIRDRLVLFDNLTEEFGRGALGATHHALYLRMLASMGVSAEEVERAEPVTSIRLLNDALDAAVKKSFLIGLSWLGIGGELTIPNNFPYLAQGARGVFQDLDSGFFDRHGTRDQEHSHDSSLLLALQLRTQADRDLVRAEVLKSLFLRAAVWDELAAQALRP